MLQNFLTFIKKNAYIFFLAIAFVYFVLYSIYHFSNRVHTALVEYDTILKYFADVSIFFFTAGIFSASLKYLQFLGVFENEFQKVIMSEQFDRKLEKHLNQITFSENFLLKQTNLHDIWAIVTLCMYKQQFPEIHNKLKKKINNDFYLLKNISYYYKNFQTNFFIKLDGASHAIIEQNASYTIIRPNEEEFDWDFSLDFLDETDNYGTLSYKVINMGGRESTDTDISSETKSGFTKITASCKLSGKHEYFIERRIILKQNIDTDRIFSFSSDRIIDDLSFQIKHCEKLGVFLSPVNNTKLYKNGAFESDTLSYINRDIFLPGEKFKIFIYRK